MADKPDEQVQAFHDGTHARAIDNLDFLRDLPAAMAKAVRDGMLGQAIAQQNREDALTAGLEFFRDVAQGGFNQRNVEASVLKFLQSADAPDWTVGLPAVESPAQPPPLPWETGAVDGAGNRLLNPDYAPAAPEPRVLEAHEWRPAPEAGPLLDPEGLENLLPAHPPVTDEEKRLQAWEDADGAPPAAKKWWDALDAENPLPNPDAIKASGRSEESAHAFMIPPGDDFDDFLSSPGASPLPESPDSVRERYPTGWEGFPESARDLPGMEKLTKKGVDWPDVDPFFKKLPGADAGALPGQTRDDARTAEQDDDRDEQTDLAKEQVALLKELLAVAKEKPAAVAEAAGHKNSAVASGGSPGKRERSDTDASSKAGAMGGEISRWAAEMLARGAGS